MALGETTVRDDIPWSSTLERLHSAPGVTIAVAVYNGGEVVRRCLESVVAHKGSARVVVIDDASPDPATRRMLDDFAELGAIELVRHEENWGYTRTANHALELGGDDDVVLLNSDTEVGPLWWQRLRWSAYGHERVATVSAASDNAGAMAVPRPGEANEWGPWLSWDEVARWVARHQATWGQEVPTAHGFCMYIRRDAANDVGTFDAEAFPRGYGEENDYSLRASARGWKHLWAPHVMVKHAKGTSFGEERAGLMAKARAVVLERHPDYETRVRRWRSHPRTARLLEAARTQQEQLASQESVLPSVLYVIHRAGGGTPATNLDLMGGLSDRQESYLLEAVGGHSVALSTFRDGELVQLEKWTPAARFNVADSWRADYGAYFAGVIARLGIELVHVRHLINQPQTTVPEVCRRMGVRMILSTHDFYSICPTVHLLDENLVHCGGICTPGHGRCTLTTTFNVEAPHPLKHGWVNVWQDRSRQVFDVAERIIATTPSATSLHTKVFPEFAHKFQIIEHGRDVTEMEPVRESTGRRTGPLRIVAIANWSIQKGPEYLRALAHALGPAVEWHVLGSRGEMLSDVAAVHGAYTRETLGALLSEIDPDFSAILSISPETYSHTLTESWSMGIPVISTDLGAVADRIRKWGGGFVVQLDDVPGAVDRIRPYVHDPELVTQDFRPTPRWSIRSSGTMAEDYNMIYWHAGAGAQASTTPPLPTVGLLIHGRAGKHHPPTAWIRVLRLATHPAAAKRARFRVVHAADLVSGADSAHYDVVLVQRDAVPGDLVAPLMAELERRGCPLVVELDDDMITPSAMERLAATGYEQSSLVGIKALALAADRVITSTAPLAKQLARLASPPTIFENRLDPRLWLTPPPQPAAGSHDVVRLLYAGSATHGQDLELVWELPSRLSERLGTDVILDVVGVTKGKLGPNMSRRRPPDSRYPDYVRWLRAAASRCTLALAPLVDDEFTRAKSDIKLLEYALMRLPTVASAVGPYRDAHPDLAAVVTNDIDAWVDTCATLITDRDRAAAQVEAAYDHVIAHRIIDDAAVDRWLDAVLGA